MRKFQYRMVRYYPWWLKILTWIHFHLEHYCSVYCLKMHKQNTKITWRFKCVAKVEFWLRNKIRPITVKYKQKYMNLCEGCGK